MRLIILLFILLNHAYASEFLVYTDSTSLYKEHFNTQQVFSSKEKTFLKGSNVPLNVLKIEVQSEKELKRFIKTRDPKALYERNKKIEYFSNDQFEDLQWGIKNNGQDLINWVSDINITQTQGVSGEDIQLDSNETSQKIKVAIIDSGIDINHPDLKDQIYTHPQECLALEEYNQCLNSQSDQDICHEKYKDFDANNNGYPLDCHGWNITGKSNPKTEIEGNGNINDNNGHGTHIAGIIGAKKNKIGVRGIIQHVSLLPIQVSVASQNNSQTTATDKFAKALLYAIKSKAQVVNMSLGWRFEQDSLLMRKMIELAFKQNILIVAAAGNDHHSAPTYPCSYEEVICVASHTVNGKLSSFSNFGAHIDLSAPGTKILSTWPTNKRSRHFTIDDDYEYLSGTSQAAPFVSGVLARLLNQGMTPQESKVALLKGTRAKLDFTKSLIRHGNVDYKSALSLKDKSFIYPLLKSPALVRWSDQQSKTFKIKFKNYLKASNEIKINLKLRAKETQPQSYLINKKISISQMDKDEVKEISIKMNSPYDVDGNFVIEADIESNQEHKTYAIEVKALNLITPNSSMDNLGTLNIKGDISFAQDAMVRPFKNYTQDKTNDYLVTKVINNKTHIALLKSIDNHYQITKSFALPIKDPVMINLSKVDLELDGKADYVITAVDIIDRENRVTKFLALDDQFKPKKISLAPKNTFDNDITVLPGSFFWLKFNQRMVPSWITLGKRPKNERDHATPWSNAPLEMKKQRLYLQLPEGIKTINFTGQEELPLHFLYQSPKHRHQGVAMLVSSQGFGYFKSYTLYKFDQRLKKIKSLKLNRFFDLASARPLPISRPKNDDHAFFNTPSVLGEQNVLGLRWSESANKLKVISKKAKTISPRRPIKFVLSLSDKAIMSQTKNLLISQGNESLTSSPSKTDSRRIKHHILVGQQGLFLSSALTPGIGSEVIRPYSDNQQLYRPAHWQNLAVKGCSEVGFDYENGKDVLIFICPQAKKIHKLTL